MTVVNEIGERTHLPRLGRDSFWTAVHEHYAGSDAKRWKYLAMLALRENAGWPLDQIGLAFGHPRGHVSRCLTKIKNELRNGFEVEGE